MAKVSKRARQRNLRFEATRLLGRWTSLARGHVVMGGNCSCGVATASVRVEEFEQQILEYLDSAFASAGISPDLRRRAGYEPGKGGSLDALLRSIAADAPQPQSAEWLSVLDALNRTLESFEQAHGGT